MAMNENAKTVGTLFNVEPTLPSGLSYYEDFLSDDEEKQFINLIQSTTLHPFRFHGYEAKREVESFGFHYSFEKKALSRGMPIPTDYHPLIRRVEQFTNVTPIEQLLLTRYPAGSVINWHRDAFPFETIIGISLASSCIMRFRPHGQPIGRRKIISLNLAPRSMYIMKNSVRTDWEHSTLPVPSTRYSITLRTLRKTATTEFENDSVE
jgi:alkylated DNA repair dioxygenase AlkB